MRELAAAHSDVCSHRRFRLALHCFLRSLPGQALAANDVLTSLSLEGNRAGSLEASRIFSIFPEFPHAVCCVLGLAPP